MNYCNLEIGGYFSLECAKEPLYHDQNAIYVNSARNALRLIVRTLNIRKVALPYFTCDVVWKSLLEEGCELHFYDINEAMEPILTDIPSNITIIVNNYFGVKTDFIKKFSQEYPNTIVDNAQAFYSPHFGLASIYSPRKFFGLPDGGIVITDKFTDSNFKLEKDILSHQRCSHLLKRIDLGANAAYVNFSENDKSLENEPIKKISDLTSALMGNIDYETAKIRRRENYQHLHSNLKNINQLNINLEDLDVPMVYPLLIEKEGLREYLIQNNIYIATYWPKIETIAPISSYSLFLQKNLLPLPIDQRYSAYDMENIIHQISNFKKQD